MQRKKTKEEFEEEEMGDDIESLKYLDDEGEDEEIELPIVDEKLREDVDKLLDIKSKIISAVKTNQKYIRKNMERVQAVENNLKVLLEKLK